MRARGALPDSTRTFRPMRTRGYVLGALVRVRSTRVPIHQAAELESGQRCCRPARRHSARTDDRSESTHVTRIPKFVRNASSRAARVCAAATTLGSLPLLLQLSGRLQRCCSEAAAPSPGTAPSREQQHRRRSPTSTRPKACRAWSTSRTKRRRRAKL